MDDLAQSLVLKAGVAPQNDEVRRMQRGAPGPDPVFVAFSPESSRGHPEPGQGDCCDNSRRQAVKLEQQELLIVTLSWRSRRFDISYHRDIPPSVSPDIGAI
jgi:hypothetical protein